MGACSLGYKNREPVLDTSARELIYQHIQQNALAKEFYIAEVNGYVDHIHCLMPLKADWSIAKQMNMIKGESANWVNKNGILVRKLEWANEYFAASVSEDKLGMFATIYVTRRFIIAKSVLNLSMHSF